MCIVTRHLGAVVGRNTASHVHRYRGVWLYVCVGTQADRYTVGQVLSRVSRDTHFLS